MNWRKSDRRSRLVSVNLDALLRVHINGPKPSAFNALKYAQLWVNSNHYSSDHPQTLNSIDSTKYRTEQQDEARTPDRVVDEDADIVLLEDSSSQPTFAVDLADPDVPPIF
jgi:hypothetical protein